MEPRRRRWRRAADSLDATETKAGRSRGQPRGTDGPGHGGSGGLQRRAAMSRLFGCEDEDATGVTRTTSLASSSKPNLNGRRPQRLPISRVEEKHKVGALQVARPSGGAVSRLRCAGRGRGGSQSPGGDAAQLAVEGSDGGSTDEGSDAASVDEQSPSDDDDDWVDEEWEPRLQECLFDGHQSASFEENCAYMQKTHSFHLPFPHYLRDSRGLFAYLQEKMYCYHTCIYCNRVFGDLDAVRNIEG